MRFERRCVAGLWTREATAADLPVLAEFFDVLLYRDYFFRRGHLADLLEQRNVRVQVVMEGWVLVAVAVQTTSNSSLLNLLVHPAYRGLGIGRALLAMLEPERVRVKTDASTGNAAGFYRKLGYRRVERRRRVSTYARPARKSTGFRSRSSAGS